jgi:predicted RND superfamily exporter protein
LVSKWRATTRTDLDGLPAAPYIDLMTENQIMSLVLLVLVLVLVLRTRRLPREGILPKIAIWLAIFAALGLFYSIFGPFGNF